MTGTHNFKMGFNRVHGYLRVRNYDFQPVTYRFNNGVPNLITMRATPYTTEAHQDNDFGLFAQDRWTLDRWTFSGGLRFDAFQTSYPEQSFGPGPLVPTATHLRRRTNPDGRTVPTCRRYWDMFGNGKRAEAHAEQVTCRGRR